MKERNNNELASEMGSDIPAKKRKLSFNFDDLLNEIFLDHKERNSDSFNDSIADGEGVAGKIKSIKLQNFMCHSNLEFNFGDKINFISGKNGSGKSAILTALVVGLGGKTADTNRGQSIKNLIQNGKHRAVIEITICNSGPSKYKHYRYGNTIKVCRVITGTSSQYKIISEKGEVVSTKREDIDIINMYFNIQVNNPVTILNQDTARTFLKTALPKDLYSIFKKGTHLGEIEKRILSLKNEKVPSIEKMVHEKKGTLQEAYDDIIKYGEKRKKFEEHQQYEDEAVDIENQLFWAYVYDIEKKLTTQKSFEKQCEEQLPLIKDKVNKREKIKTDLKDKQKVLESNLKDVKSEIRDIENDIIELERSLKNSKEQIAVKVNEIKRFQKTIDNEKNSCKEVESEIANHQSRSEEAEARKAQLEIQKEELGKRLGELKAVKNTTQVHQRQLSDTKNAATSAYTQKEQFCHNLKKKLGFKEENLKALQREKNQLMVYSKWMPELVNEIEKAFKAGKFKKKPHGPIGSFIQLKDTKWGPAIENQIGAKTLSSFCVDNNQDFKTLKFIIDRMDMHPNMRPPIIISKFIEKVFDVRSNETGNERYTNLLRSIIIKDPIVANALIDSIEPETILLVPTSEEAYQFLEDVEKVPKNCKRAITLSGDLYFPAPNARSYAGRVANSTKFLQVSQAQAVKSAQHEIHSIKEELERSSESLQKAKMEVAICQEKLDQVNKEIYNLNKQITTCENKLDELKKEEVTETFDVHLLKEDLVYRKKKIETGEDQIKVLESTKDELLVKYKEIKSNFEKRQSEKNSKDEEAQKIENERSELINEFYKLSGKNDHYVTLLKNEEAKLDKIKGIIADLQKKLDKAEKEAKEVHPERIPPTKDIQLLETELQKIQSMAKALKNIIGDINAVPDNYSLKVKELQKKDDTLKNLTVTTKNLKDVVRIVGDTYNKLKALVTVSTNYSFSDMLKKKKFTGNLVIDHEKEILKVVIKVESAANAFSSTLTLSGGERSYSMVSFIMALWNNMYSPFFFLDEFDVFMDEINRNMIMSMLLEYAKSKPDQQFVFLTPHANLNSELLKEVNFFRMNDPRGQDDD